MTNGGSGNHTEYNYAHMVCPALVKSTSPPLRVSWQLVRSCQGLHITYGVMWYQIGQGSPPGAEGKLRIDNHDEGNGKPPCFIPPPQAWHGLCYCIER